MEQQLLVCYVKNLAHNSYRVLTSQVCSENLRQPEVCMMPKDQEDELQQQQKKRLLNYRRRRYEALQNPVSVCQGKLVLVTEVFGSCWTK